MDDESRLVVSMITVKVRFLNFMILQFGLLDFLLSYNLQFTLVE